MRDIHTHNHVQIIHYLKRIKNIHATHTHVCVCVCVCVYIRLYIYIYIYLADAFVQSDLQCSAFRLYIYCQHVCSLGIEPSTFALLTQCSTTEPQEH